MRLLWGNMARYCHVEDEVLSMSTTFQMVTLESETSGTAARDDQNDFRRSVPAGSVVVVLVDHTSLTVKADRAAL